MKYERPLCDCGGEVELYEEFVVVCRKKFSNNGALSKAYKIVYNTGISNKPAWLECIKCNTKYSYEMWLSGKYKGKLIRKKDD